MSPFAAHADAMLEIQSVYHEPLSEILLDQTGNKSRKCSPRVGCAVCPRTTEDVASSKHRVADLDVWWNLLNAELGLRTSAARVGSLGVARELDDVVLLELERLLEPLSDLQQNLLALLLGPALACVAGDGAADSTCPQTDTVEASPNVDDDTHDFVVVLVLEVLADGSKHDMEPECIDVDLFLLPELEGPFAAVLVLRVFPLGLDALLEEVVVGLQREVGCGGNVVLRSVSRAGCGCSAAARLT